MSTAVAPSPGTREAVRRLLAEASEVYAGTAHEEVLRQATDQLDGPLRVAFAGRVKAGKSTLLNALVGQPLAATDATECTRVVTSYVNGPAVRAWALPLDGEPVQVPFTRRGGQTHIDLGHRQAEELAQLVVETPSSRLERMTLIDTPGIGSVRSDVSSRTERFLTGTGAGADAVLYLMRHLHVADVGFLRAFHDEQFDGTAPINAIGILSRADEMGGGRLDTLEVAARIAADYRVQPRVRSLVQTVVPASGLIALAATQLQERQFVALGALASAPASVLLSADRVLHAHPDRAPTAEVRAELLDALGVFGVRLSVALLREGRARDAGELATALGAVSGLDEVRRLLTDRFMARAGTLKSQNAIRTLEAVLGRAPVAAGDRLRRRLEDVLANAHEVVELRLLNDLRTGEVLLDDALRAEAERVLGGEGESGPVRLGLGPDVPPEEVRAAVLTVLRRWQRLGSSPVASPAVRRTADVVRRTCEGLL